MTQDTPLFRPDGRLTSLALERLHAGQLSIEDTRRAQLHLASHQEDRERLAALQRDQSDFDKRPEPAWLREATAPSALLPPQPQPPPANSGWKSAWVLAAVALIAVGVRASMPGPDDVVEREVPLRTKGPDLAMTLVLDDLGTARPLQPGDSVKAGDRIGIRVSTAAGGHLTLFGADETGSVYTVWPTDDRTGRTTPGETVETAIRVDDQPGTEWLLAVRCDTLTPLTTLQEEVATLARAKNLTVPSPPDGCVLSSQHIVKPSAATP